jgi:uncharacterized lipoprotein YddW (UPF0748 family)
MKLRTWLLLDLSVILFIICISPLNSWSAVGDEVFADNDNGSPDYTESGGWFTGGSTGYNGLTYRFATTGNANSATWSATLPEAGDWRLDVIYRAGGNRPTSARYTVQAASGAQVAFVNQTTNNLSWVALGTWSFSAGSASVTLDAAGSTPSGRAAIADAIRFTQITTANDPDEIRLASITVFDDINDTIAIQTWVDDVVALNHNAIAVHTRYRGDATYFPNKTNSTFPNNEPRSSAAGSIDVLEEFTTRGQAAGLKVYAYVNTHLVTDGTATIANPNHVVNVHPTWRTYEYNDGSPVIQTLTQSGDGLWMDPAIPGYKAYLANICGDIMSNYNCDGIILDRIRYPQSSFTRANNDFGYNPIAVATYNAQFGKSGTPDPNDPDWILFRQHQITTTVNLIYQTITSIDPDHELLGFPLGRFNDAIIFAYQDWPTWMDAEIIDSVLPQIYTNNDTLFSSRCDEHRAAYSGPRLLGITHSAFQTAVNLTNQVQIIRNKNFDGTSPFRHGVLSFNGYRDDVEAAYPNPSNFPPMPWKGTLDSTAPSAPTGLSASAGNGSIDLDWNDSTATDLAGYNVYRSTSSGGPYTQIDTQIPLSRYTDSGLTNSTTYHYRVTAEDYSLNESGNSATVSATPVNTIPANALDMDNFTIGGYGTQDVNSSSWELQDSGYTMRLYGNTWKTLNLNYTVTANTVIEFDYKSTGTEPEIGGIVFDNDLSLSSGQTWKVYGTQNYGITTYDNYSGNDWVHYTIPVGATLSAGTYQYLVLMNDKDSGSGTNSFIRNIEVYEETFILDDDNGSPEYTTTGGWSTSGSSGYNGGTYQFATAGGTATATWDLDIPTDGDYLVEVMFRASGNRATTANYDISHASGTASVNLNQTINNLVWVTLGSYTFDANSGSVTLDADDSSGGAVVIADAVRVTKQ